MKRIWMFMFVLSLATLILSCNSSQNKNEESIKSKTLSGDIKIDGSSTVYPITEAVAEEFRILYPEVRVSVGISGTGGGFKKFYRGETDISDASRKIKESEVEACKKNGISYEEFKVGIDGMAVVVNPENDWVDYFTVEELKKIWEPDAQGTITKWNQIRPEWPDEELHLYGPGVASGTYDYFTEVVVGESGHSRGDYTASEDDNVLVQGIAGDKYALGFFGLAYYMENQDKLKIVPVDNGQGPVIPDFETVKNGTYSPLSRPLFIYVNIKSLEKPEVREFVKFYLTNAGKLVSDVGYISLPDDEYKMQLNRIEKIISSVTDMGKAMH